MLRSSCLAWMLPMKHICYLSYNRSGCSSWISFITVVIQAHASSAGCQSRFSFSFLPKRGQNDIVWTIGGEASMYSCAKHVANLGRPAGGHAPGNGDFEPFNLVESGTAGTHTTPIFQTVYSIPSWSHAYLCSFSRYEGCLNSRAPILAYIASAHGWYEYSYPWLSHARTMAHACLPTVARVSLSRLGAE